jgi:hypothetical protein
LNTFDTTVDDGSSIVTPVVPYSLESLPIHSPSWNTYKTFSEEDIVGGAQNLDAGNQSNDHECAVSQALPIESHLRVFDNAMQEKARPSVPSKATRNVTKRKKSTKVSKACKKHKLGHRKVSLIFHNITTLLTFI